MTTSKQGRLVPLTGHTTVNLFATNRDKVGAYDLISATNSDSAEVSRCGSIVAPER